MMEYNNTGVTEFMIGIPTAEEQKKLKNEGYTHMSNGRTVDGEPYEIRSR